MKKEFKIMSDEDLIAWKEMCLKQEKEVDEKLKMFDGQKWEDAQEYSKMNIYKCSQTHNDNWDTYDSFVCYANNAEEAKNMKPYYGDCNYSWCSPEYVTVELIGTCNNVEVGLILASFNAG